MNSTQATLLKARRLAAERGVASAHSAAAVPELPTGLARARHMAQRSAALPAPLEDRAIELLRLDAGRRFKLSAGTLKHLGWEPAQRLRIHSFASQLVVTAWDPADTTVGAEATLDRGGRLCLGPGQLMALGLGRDADRVQAFIDPTAGTVRLVDPRRLAALLDAVTPTENSDTEADR